MPVARLARRQNRAVEHVQRRKQRGCAVALVVVGDAFDIAKPHGQHRLRTLQRIAFPARRLIHMKSGVPRRNRFGHISPDTLNVALRRLPLDDIEHFTVHDMRRTARTHMAALGVDRFVAERALNHKVRDVEGVYNQYDYFEERKVALERWVNWLAAIEEARNGGAASTQASEDAMAALAKQAQELGMGYERSGRRSSADDTHSP